MSVRHKVKTRRVAALRVFFRVDCLFVSVQPLANIVADYACRNGDKEGNYVLHYVRHLLSVASIGVTANILLKKDLRKSTFFDNFFMFYAFQNYYILVRLKIFLFFGQFYFDSLVKKIH